MIFFELRFPISSIYLSIFSEKSSNDLFANIPAFSEKVPSVSIAYTSVGNLCFSAICSDQSSCHGVTLCTHVHLNKSTDSSAMIGIVLFIIGIMTFCHTNFLYLLSIGLTATATSPKIVLISVVVSMMAYHLDSTKYFSVYSMTSFSTFFILISGTSACKFLLRNEVSFFTKILFS
jgi:hypothetical protein